MTVRAALALTALAIAFLLGLYVGMAVPLIIDTMEAACPPYLLC